ncbi:precorrin-2 dehydrogenase/sirohydrochlorin ferrochelatase family protein [Ignavigranum ruoffiae]|uniref:precorrin-2 dehydrogenase n=1 Tax=Ignavigranum ruoffiae TaxID=89093 RepID=A0A1H9CG41_9LACT|nr:bifunctional precorrin-2 dehydrogenase/sirohydrochlorin ferrochelatase [Ignavigranum ruoffiae]SEQ00124.1 precorrin-2 dehydrogenase / sirohydrochlorin ferrochelatase [Ignavigranum ruoffiae]
MYPILLDLTNRPILVVGGGKVASRKINQLLENNAKVTVISPYLSQEINKKQINWICKTYQPSDSLGYDLIFACTDNETLNEEIYNKSNSGQFVNNASNKHKSDFYNMKVIKSGDYLFSVSSLGENYKHTKRIGNNLKKWLDKNLTELLK